MADLQKKSGFRIYLHDPEGKLKDRKITLDTGETSFWHAYALLCDKAELTEASVRESDAGAVSRQRPDSADAAGSY